MELKSFSEIKKWLPLRMVITQKIHGSNAQVCIFPKGQPSELIPGNVDTAFNADGTPRDGYDVKVGSRERWIFPGKTTDNFGFAQFVEDNKQEFIDKLGPGTHYGEWAGPGINSGEGLKEKTFILFNHGRPYENGLPPRTVLAPVLFDSANLGEWNPGLTPDIYIDSVMTDLKLNGSKLVPGFMRPEGCVIEYAGKKYKKVFKAEETQWKDPSKVKDPNAPKRKDMDYSHLCQPIRLEKLLSRDENYVTNYPESLGSIVKAYMDDLEKEDQFPKDPDEMKATRKNATGQVFKFIKACVEQVQDGRSLT